MATKSSRKKGLIAVAPPVHKPLPQKAPSSATANMSPAKTASNPPSAGIYPQFGSTSALHSAAPPPAIPPKTIQIGQPPAPSAPTENYSGGINSISANSSSQSAPLNQPSSSSTIPKPAIAVIAPPNQSTVETRPPSIKLSSFKDRTDVNPPADELNKRFSKYGNEWNEELAQLFQNMENKPPAIDRSNKYEQATQAPQVHNDENVVTVESDDEEEEKQEEVQPEIAEAKLETESKSEEIEGVATSKEIEVLAEGGISLDHAMAILAIAKKEETKGRMKEALQHYRAGIDELHELFLEEKDPNERDFIRTLISYHFNRCEEVRIMNSNTRKGDEEELDRDRSPRKGPSPMKSLSALGTSLANIKIGKIQTDTAFQMANSLALKARDLDNNELAEQAIDTYQQSVDQLKVLLTDPKYEEDRQFVAGRILVYEKRMVDLLKYRKYPKKAIPAPYSHAVEFCDRGISKTGLGKVVQKRFEKEMEERFVKDDPEYKEYKMKEEEKLAEKEKKKFLKSKEGKKQLKAEEKEKKEKEKQDEKDRKQEEKDRKEKEKQEQKERKEKEKQEKKEAKSKNKTHLADESTTD